MSVFEWPYGTYNTSAWNNKKHDVPKNYTMKFATMEKLVYYFNAWEKEVCLRSGHPSLRKRAWNEKNHDDNQQFLIEIIIL